MTTTSLFHSSWRWPVGGVFLSVAFLGTGRGRASFSHLSMLLFFPLWHQGLVILRQNRFKKKRATNMQVFKFSSFTVYCRKKGNFHKVKISKARWFSILLLCLRLLFLIFFLLSLLFILLFFWGLVFYRQVLQLLCNRVRTLGVICSQKDTTVTFLSDTLNSEAAALVNLHLIGLSTSRWASFKFKGVALTIV